MSVKPIDLVSDPRVTSKHAVLNGYNHHYLLGIPQDGNFRATIFLIHGWPDLSFGWRYQIPVLLDLGLRVVAPDLMGFGNTDAPHVPPEPIELYSMKRASDNLAELAKQLGASRIILGGHDWGGMVVWRAALWHPELITHVFAVCTPYTPPSTQYMSTEAVVDRMPQFGYQLHLKGPEVEGAVKTKEQLRQFFNTMYGGRTPDGKQGFVPTKGILLDLLPQMGKTPLLSEQELDYYVDQYARNGLHSTLNWYRTREVNHNEEQGLKKSTIEIPTLFICAKQDSVLIPKLSEGMEKFLPRLTRREVDGTHWVLWQKPDEVNKVLKEWFQNVVFGEKSKL